ncbi:MAG: helix-turn-helix domain-containing protein [Planctomycetes bacterium]|nr:helix-turn-helix domain-containing protein [Planctomycetota bacterium]
MQINTSDRFHAPQRPAWFARPFYPPGFRYPFHAHAFAEVFWIVQGQVRHRLEDREEILRPGDVRFLHPTTGHALAAHGGAAILANLAFPADLLPKLQPLAGELPFVPGKVMAGRVAPAARTALEDWGDRLSSDLVSLLDVGAFLLWLLAETRRPAGQAPRGPAWLAQALADLDHPGPLAAGASGLVKASGKSASAVGKHIRRQFDCTIIQLVNRRRLAWLAEQLRTTQTPIPELAATCGLANLSNCYRRFKETYGCPPGVWRARKGG